MATRTELSLPEAQVERVELVGDTLRIHLREFFSFVSISGSAEQTQWRQPGVLIIEAAEIEHELPEAPFVLAGGDIQANTYTYRDRVPLPLDALGRVGCLLKVKGNESTLSASGARLQLQTLGERRYVAHVK